MYFPLSAYSGLHEDSVISSRRETKRPTSAKAALNASRKQSRPASANRMAPGTRRVPSATKLTSQSMLLSRLKPNRISQDKEVLYELNLAIKLQLNDLRKENRLLKTKIVQLERELLRILNSPESRTRDSYLQTHGQVAKVNGLRRKVQILNQELVSREEENDDLRRDILFTKKSELEAQVSAYEEECGRLRERVGELTEERDRLARTEQLHQQQERNMDELERQNEDLRKALNRIQKDAGKWKRSSSKEKRKISSSKAEIANLKLEIQRLKGFLSSESPGKKPIKSTPSPVPKSVQVTQAEIKREIGYEFNAEETAERMRKFASEKGMNLTSLISSLGTNGDVWTEDLFVGLRKQGFYLEREEAGMLLSQIRPSGHCPVSEILAFLGKSGVRSPGKTVQSPVVPVLKPIPKAESQVFIPKVQLSDLKDVLRHIGYRLQLQRVPKSKLMSLIIGSSPDRFRTLQVSQLQQILENPPFDVQNSTESRLLARFLIETDKTDANLTAEMAENMKKSVGDIVEKLNRSLEAWEGFSPEEEEEFDHRIGLVLNRHKMTFKAACKTYDSVKSGVISLADFDEVLESLEINFSAKEKHYLLLLFYSSLQQLDAVPYKELLRAYTEGPESTEPGPSSQPLSQEPSESEIRGMIQKYMQLIANALVSHRKTVSDVFHSTAGYVSPKQFYEGYCSLKLPSINQQSLGMLVEALQGDEEREDYAIRLELLEDVFSHYGVDLGESGGHQKQVSNLDSPSDDRQEAVSSEDEYREEAVVNGQDKSLPLSEQSPFYTGGKATHEVPPSSIKQWQVSDSDEDYADEHFDSGSVRSI